MTEEDFEGSLILERLASIGLKEEFFDAIDSDNMSEIISMMEEANIDEDSVRSVLKQIKDS